MDQIRRLSVEFAQIKGLAAAASPQNPNSCSLLPCSARRSAGSRRRRSCSVLRRAAHREAPSPCSRVFSRPHRAEQQWSRTARALAAERRRPEPPRRCARSPCAERAAVERLRARCLAWPATESRALAWCPRPFLFSFFDLDFSAMFLVFTGVRCPFPRFVPVWIWALGLGWSRF